MVGPTRKGNGPVAVQSLRSSVHAVPARGGVDGRFQFRRLYRADVVQPVRPRGTAVQISLPGYTLWRGTPVDRAQLGCRARSRGPHRVSGPPIQARRRGKPTSPRERGDEPGAALGTGRRRPPAADVTEMDSGTQHTAGDNGKPSAIVLAGITQRDSTLWAGLTGAQLAVPRRKSERSRSTIAATTAGQHRPPKTEKNRNPRRRRYLATSMGYVAPRHCSDARVYRHDQRQNHASPPAV